jgi:hypothetical protein
MDWRVRSRRDARRLWISMPGTGGSWGRGGGSGGCACFITGLLWAMDIRVRSASVRAVGLTGEGELFRTEVMICSAGSSSSDELDGDASSEDAFEAWMGDCTDEEFSDCGWGESSLISGVGRGGFCENSLDIDLFLGVGKSSPDDTSSGDDIATGGEGFDNDGLLFRRCLLVSERLLSPTWPTITAPVPVGARGRTCTGWLFSGEKMACSCGGLLSPRLSRLHVEALRRSILSAESTV